MPNYELDIRIPEKDLPTIHRANEEVIIVKPVEGQSNVEWITFKPFEHDTVKWSTESSLSASTNPPQGGAK